MTKLRFTLSEEATEQVSQMAILRNSTHEDILSAALGLLYAITLEQQNEEAQFLIAREDGIYGTVDL